MVCPGQGTSECEAEVRSLTHCSDSRRRGGLVPQSGYWPVVAVLTGACTARQVGVSLRVRGTTVKIDCLLFPFAVFTLLANTVFGTSRDMLRRQSVEIFFIVDCD